MSDDADEIRRLLREYERLPKTPHGLELPETHPEVSQEWIIRIIEQPYDQWEEFVPHRNEVRTILVGRVREFNQWIKVVFIGDVGTGELHTAYPDRQLERRYGGRPWQSQS
ncbi:MAG: hypothetical protein J4G13_13025 [Dehalococcoidia bacterium]|nr:hypothetical protein [Dehalococcoidia bacterium]